MVRRCQISQQHFVTHLSEKIIYFYCRHMTVFVLTYKQLDSTATLLGRPDLAAPVRELELLVWMGEG